MTIGHNSARGEELRSIVERIERLQDEAKEIAGYVSDTFKEAKERGYDVKALREVIRLRKIDPDERAEREALIETYKHALGMLPLEEAIAKASPDAVPAVHSAPEPITDRPFAPPADDLPDIPAELDRRKKPEAA